MPRTIYLLPFFLLCSILGFTQQPIAVVGTDSLQAGDTLVKHMVQIVDVQIEGNKKTREYVIRREMSLLEGEVVALEDLENLLAVDKKRISNTRLFINVELGVDTLSSEHIRILVSLQERWYFVPAPIFKLADRNFNDWWTNQQRDLSRVNYGFRFKHYNFMGRAEQLTFLAQFGYTRSFILAYSLPYIDKSRKNGLSFNTYYFENNNLPLRTINHKRIFLNDDERQLRKTFGAGMSFSRRASFYTTHYGILTFNANTLADTVVVANPEYTPESSTNVRYFSLGYGFSRDLRDNVSYPLKGFVLRAFASQRGLGIFQDVNIFDLETSFAIFKPLSKRLFVSNYTNVRLSTPAKQAYYLQKGLGFGMDYVRGMELYVLEGQHYALNKSELKWQMFKKEFNLSKIVPWEQFSLFPLAIYPKVYFDAAYVSVEDPLPNNDLLINKPIWGAGFGFDVVSFYDFLLQIEYSVNSLNERGLFFNMNRSF